MTVSQGQAQWPVRVAVPLLVLLGILGMHGLAAPHHAAAAISHAAAPAHPATTHDTEHAQVEQDHAHGHTHGQTPGRAPSEGTARSAATHPQSAPQVAALTTVGTDSPDGGTCTDCATTTLLCLGILTVAAVVWLVLRGRRAQQIRKAQQLAVVQGAPTTGTWPRPRDPVRELCVSRT